MNLSELIYKFLFDYQIHASFAAFLRISIVTYLMACVISSLKDILKFTNPLGIFNRKVFKNVQERGEIPLILPTLFSFAKDSKFLCKLIYILFFLSGICAIAGLVTNISLALFAILFVSIQNRAYPILLNNGVVIEKLMLIALIFMDCGAKYSIDGILNISSNSEYIDGWGARLVQLTIPIIYFQSSLYKLKDPSWNEGLIMRFTLTTFSVSRSLVKYIYPLLILRNKMINILLTKSVVYFEFFAPILFIFSETRLLALTFFFLMHLGIIILYRIDFFGSTMIMGLLFYLNQYFY